MFAKLMQIVKQYANPSTQPAPTELEAEIGAWLAQNQPPLPNVSLLPSVLQHIDGGVPVVAITHNEPVLNDNPYRQLYGTFDTQTHDFALPDDLDLPQCTLQWDPTPEQFGGAHIYFAYRTPWGPEHGRSDTLEGACRTLRYRRDFWAWAKASGKGRNCTDEEYEAFNSAWAKTPASKIRQY